MHRTTLLVALVALLCFASSTVEATNGSSGWSPPWIGSGSGWLRYGGWNYYQGNAPGACPGSSQAAGWQAIGWDQNGRFVYRTPWGGAGFWSGAGFGCGDFVCTWACGSQQACGRGAVWDNGSCRTVSTTDSADCGPCQSFDLGSGTCVQVQGCGSAFGTTGAAGGGAAAATNGPGFVTAATGWTACGRKGKGC